MSGSRLARAGALAGRATGRAGRALQELAGLALLPVAWLRRDRRFLRSTQAGGRTLDGAARVAVFVHYDRGGIVHDYVLFYLHALRAAGFEIVLVSNSPRLPPASLTRVLPLCAHVLWRENAGYDFGAYRDGLAFLGDLSRFAAVVLANDSVYGPVFDLSEALTRCDPAVPIWGITDSWAARYHLQSYFLLLQGEALRAPALAAFFAGVLPLQSKRLVVRRYEIGFTQAMLKAGLGCAALFAYRDAAASLVEAGLAGQFADPRLAPGLRGFLTSVMAMVQRGRPLNPMHQFWDHMLLRMRCPFIKRELLTRNPAGLPHAFLWERAIRAVSDYDTGMVVRHLQLAAARDRAP